MLFFSNMDGQTGPNSNGRSSGQWTGLDSIKVYYHCVVKVCEQAESDACAFYQLNTAGEFFNKFYDVILT